MSKKTKIILFSILGVIGTIIIIICIWLIVLFNKNSTPITYTNETITESTNEIDLDLNPTTIESNVTIDTITPKNYSPKEVVGITMGQLSKTNSFKVLTTGKSVANVFGITTEVKISNSRTVIGTEAMITCISAGMVSNGSQRYFNGDNVYLRTASNVNSDATAEFSDDSTVEKITKDTYLSRYGWLPTKAVGYIINDDTYLNDPTMTINDDNTYTINVSLNPNSNAAYYYKREIATNASATEDPIFEKINFIITIDESFKILKIEFNEAYKIKPGVFPIETSTETSLVDTYYYDDITFDENYYNYFKKNIS